MASVHFLLASSQITRFMGSTWGPPGSCRPQMGPMLTPWTLLSRIFNLQCRVLMVVAYYRDSVFGGIGVHWMKRVDCSGNEDTLLQCPSSGWHSVSDTDYTCGPANTAGVRCYENGLYTVRDQRKIRLYKYGKITDKPTSWSKLLTNPNVAVFLQ